MNPDIWKNRPPAERPPEGLFDVEVLCDFKADFFEFADIVRLRNSDGSLDTEASVVAVQYHPGKTVVAARFLRSVPNWIVKS